MNGQADKSVAKKLYREFVSIASHGKEQNERRWIESLFELACLLWPWRKQDDIAFYETAAAAAQNVLTDSCCSPEVVSEAWKLSNLRVDNDVFSSIPLSLAGFSVASATLVITIIALGGHQAVKPSSLSSWVLTGITSALVFFFVVMAFMAIRHIAFAPLRAIRKMAIHDVVNGYLTPCDKG